MIERLGIAPLQGPFAEDLPVLAAAEEAGFDSAWTPGHSGYVRLAAFACHTTRMRLGTGAILQPMFNPIAHATSARDLADLSNGRVIIGVGSGFKRQMTSVGIGPETALHPAARMREFLQLMRMLLDPGGGGSVTFSGKYFSFSAGRISPPKQPIPLYLAAVNPRMLQVATELADGLIGHPVYSLEYLRATVLPAIDAGLVKAGRRREDFETGRYILTSINEDRTLARRDVAIMLGFLLATQAWGVVFDASGWEEEKRAVHEVFVSGDYERFNDVITDRIVEACCLYGTPDEVKDQLKRYDGLVNHVVLYSPVERVPRERVVANFRRIIETFAR